MVWLVSLTIEYPHLSVSSWNLNTQENYGNFSQIHSEFLVFLITWHARWNIWPWIRKLEFRFCLLYAAKSLQSCPTLCDPIDGGPTGSSVPGILQARILEWVAISFSNAWKWKVKVKSLSHVWLLAIPWTAAYQAPPSMGFSRQEYWSEVPLSSPLSI